MINFVYERHIGISPFAVLNGTSPSAGKRDQSGGKCFFEDEVWKGFVNRFYCVALKREAKGKIRYRQQHIHEKLIAKAKEKLSTNILSVSEIAYALGFEHTQSFSTLFKKKTNLSPLEFRQAFN